MGGGGQPGPAPLPGQPGGGSLGGPRAVHSDPPALATAATGFIFPLATRAGRRRVADSIGWERKAVDEAVQALGRDEFLHWCGESGELLHMPPLPDQLSSQHDK